MRAAVRGSAGAGLHRGVLPAQGAGVMAGFLPLVSVDFDVIGRRGAARLRRTERLASGPVSVSYGPVPGHLLDSRVRP